MMSFGMMSGFDGFMFNVFPVVFMIMFVVILGVFAVTAFRGFREWNSNNHSPRLTVPATVVNKREDVSHRHHRDNDHVSSHYHTTYYVTFEVESGDRMELTVSGQESGLLVVGDRGQLTFQGTRYLGFVRET